MKRLIKSTPTVRRAVTRWSYEALSLAFQDPRLALMNYGFAALEDGGQSIDLAPEDEWNRFPLQLYHEVASAVSLAGKRVLEVGAGRGGGAEFVARTMGPAAVVGTDVSAAAVRFASRTHAATPNLTFRQADAEALPFSNARFDVVLNVESSHCYGHMDRFLAEVARVLRPGGHLLFADLRDTPDIGRLEAELSGATGLSLVETEDITPNVRAALDHTAGRKEELLRTMALPVRGMFLDQSGHPDGAMYRAFANGERVYLSAVLRKEDR